MTSATKVVFDRDLMHCGTVSGLDMHLTRVGIWGLRSGFASVVHNAVAHLTAAEET